MILDADLAELYGVDTKRLNQQVRRNPGRFPADFAFLLSGEEWAALRLQIATLDKGRGRHRKFLPYAFTEHGALMASRLDELEKRLEAGLTKQDQAIADILAAIRSLMTPPERKRRSIGFLGPEDA